MKHCIIVKWNEKVTDKNLFFEKACEAFEEVTEIAGVSALRIYQNCTDRANRADLMVEITCTNDGLANYDVSELHKAWKTNYGEFIEAKLVFDYE